MRALSQGPKLTGLRPILRTSSKLIFEACLCDEITTQRKAVCDFRRVLKRAPSNLAHLDFSALLITNTYNFGLKKEDIKVHLIDDRTLEISEERNKEVQEKDIFHRIERSHGKFLRRFQPPDNVEVDDVSAKSENGVLTVTVLKILEEKQTKSVAVS